MLGLPAEAMLGRLGGEEFYGGVPRHAAGRAAILAETVREQVAGQPFCRWPRAGGQHQRWRGPADGRCAQRYQNADAALYQTKSGGRNQVEVAR